MPKRQYFISDDPVSEKIWQRYQNQVRTIERQDELLRLAYEYVEDPENSPVTLAEVWMKLRGYFGD